MTEAAREAKRNYQREYRAKNREKLNEYAREYRRQNPEKIAEINNRYWERKAAKGDIDQ